MADRFNGPFRISVAYHDGDFYQISISENGVSLWAGAIGAPATQDGAVDSPEAYDGAAHAALSFASADGAIEPHPNADGSGWEILRSMRRSMRAGA